MPFYERAEEEKNRLLQENDMIRKKLIGAPDGILQCRKERNFYKWFHRTEAKDGRIISNYLQKSEREKARQLAFKTYYLQRAKDNEREMAAIDAYLKRHLKSGGKADTIRKHPAFAQLLMTRDLEKELAAWKKAPYEKSTQHEEHLSVRASNGEMVRSKSEAFILSSLAAAGIPYRYECKLVLGSLILYPDFTIRRPSNGGTVIWEHFGLMSDSAYLKNAQDKIRKYIQHGFYPMENLITTFEREGSALDFSRVMDIVEWLQR